MDNNQRGRGPYRGRGNADRGRGGGRGRGRGFYSNNNNNNNNNRTSFGFNFNELPNTTNKPNQLYPLNFYCVKCKALLIESPQVCRINRVSSECFELLFDSSELGFFLILIICSDLHSGTL